MTRRDVVRAWRGALGVLVAGALGGLTAVALGEAGTTPASAQPSPVLRYANPIRNGLTGKPLSCPDPSVIRARRGKWGYFLFCTSDNARNAFPIWMSEDLVHWYPDGSVFPHGRQPRWSVPSTGGGRAGIYWAPDIHRIGHRWVLYFSADYDAASHALGSLRLAPGTMVLGVAVADSLAGPWHTKVLHAPGELNSVNVAPDRESYGGDIDPGMVQDPRTGQRYLFWAEQRKQIWESKLSGDGLTLGPRIHVAFTVSKPWECDPADKLCTVEGPQPFYYGGRVYVLYSAASTWDASYAVGTAAANGALDPTSPFVKLAQPILRSGNGFMGPGGESDPVVGPTGQTMIMYHALLGPITSHVSGARELMLGTLNWVNSWPLVNRGVAR